MTIKIDAIYQERYLNLLSTIIKQLGIPQSINQLVPYDNQCPTATGDAIHLILWDMLSERQALVHLESWTAKVNLEKLLSSGVKAHHFNDDAFRFTPMSMTEIRLIKHGIQKFRTSFRNNSSVLKCPNLFT